MLKASGREKVMRAAIMIALADGVLAPAEASLLGRLANALGISSAHLTPRSQERPRLDARATGYIPEAETLNQNRTLERS